MFELFLFFIIFYYLIVIFVIFYFLFIFYCINRKIEHRIDFRLGCYSYPRENEKAQIELYFLNNTVEIDDDVYLLGDISWYNTTKTIEIFNNLNGNIHLIKGNHDGKLLKNRELQSRFCEIVDYKELDIGDGKIVVLCHYPIPCFKNHYYGSYHLYGHVHTGFEDNIMQQVKYQMTALYDKPCNMWNVGCMKSYMNYTPRTLEEIIKSGE